MSDKKSNPGSGKRNNKPGLSSASETAKTDSRSNQTTTVHASTQNDKSSIGWLAPLALLFGVIGTGWAAYLSSQLSALGESTSTQLQSQSEATKTSVATVKTELDEKTSTLQAAIDEKTSAISTTLDEKTAALEEQTATLSAALDEKATGLSETIEQKTGTLSEALDQKTADLSQALEQKTADLSQSLEEKTQSLDKAIQDSSGSLNGALAQTADALRTDITANKQEVATSTASAMQELTSKTELEINNVSTSFNTGLALLRERNQEKISSLETRMGQLDESVQTTNELASRGQRDWVLAEVNYLLRTAVHRVKLAGDTKAGVIALESASDRLHTLGDINYLPVREQIAEEVAALRQIGPPDIEGLIFKLQHMSKRADNLPLPMTEAEKTQAAIKDDPVAATKSIGNSLFSRLKGSVSIGPAEGGSQTTTEAPAKAAPKEEPSQEQLNASDALRLHLQAARLSALRHDSENFAEHMDNSIAYSQEIFDQESDQVKTYISDLMEIKETPIVPKTPTLGSSLSLFSKIDAKRGEN